MSVVIALASAKFGDSLSGSATGAQRCRVAASDRAGRSACKSHGAVPPDIGKTRTEEASLRKLIGLFAACVALSAGAAVADEVGKVGVDWVGNDIMVDAIKD